jgi:hypothetical protein
VEGTGNIYSSASGDLADLSLNKMCAGKEDKY